MTNWIAARQTQSVMRSLQILPSYGMSECMPISSPPATYQLEKPGTSGVPVGPEVAILNVVTGKELPVGTEGPICIRGYPCFRGYGKIASDSAENIAIDDVIIGGWFNTGDLGYLVSSAFVFCVLYFCQFSLNGIVSLACYTIL
jgi:long-subunit acyl-CoA synthetase (AMP-forming)